MYIPDKGLLDRMKKYDSKLDVRWDSSKERGEVTRKCPAPSRLYEVDTHIMHIQNDDGSYRPFDERSFRLLKSVDHHHRKTQDIIREQVESQKKAHTSSLRKDKAEMDALVADPMHWAAKKDADTFGATNLPKEDLKKEMAPRFKGVEEEIASVEKL